MAAATKAPPKGYKKARAELNVVDQLVRALDDARVKTGVSKAELARLISAKPVELIELRSRSSFATRPPSAWHRSS
jgi:ribosome-binding protein aMBF1 (putative translation factor)